MIEKFKKTMSGKVVSAGFTLIELLVVIAIIAILAIVVLLTLNPGQLIAQARDSNRISDLATIKSAVAYYLQDVASPAWPASATCYEDGPLAAGVAAPTTNCPWFVTASGTIVSTSSRSVNGATGWIPINLGKISVGSPISQWPADPLNTGFAGTYAAGSSTDFFYSFAASTTSAGGYKLAALMESAKFSSGGASDVETNDGGSSSSTYEQGSNLAL
jgi:prepilin-type N-terminal cleavage/methylation domain-containing protein